MTQEEFLNRIKEVTKPLPGEATQQITYTLGIKKEFEGRLLIDFLNEKFPSIKAQTWKDKIHSKNLTIDNQFITETKKIKAGELLKHTSFIKSEPTVNPQIQLIYDDEDILVINKPAPLPVHPSGRFNKNTLTSFLNLAFPNLHLKLLHRIDANTTGIVIFGKTDSATKYIRSQFTKQTVLKKYIALVDGLVSEQEFSSNLAIGKEKLTSGKRDIQPQGLASFSEFKVLHQNIPKQQTLLQVIPHSGRTNQIRIHLAKLGFPIIGDIGYKNPTYFKNHPLTYPTDCLFLHAWQLTFIHPSTKQKMTCTAKIPAKFNEI